MFDGAMYINKLNSKNTDILVLSIFSEEKMLKTSNTRNQSVFIFRKPI